MAKRLQIYFDALNVIASTNDAAALAYGAVRIVLQLASVLPTFFDRLLSTISHLTDKFPQYEAIADIFDGNPSLRMRTHLEKVYQDFFEFLRLAANIFTASNGGIKRPVKMIAKVAWKPFDVRFGDILTQMEEHHNFVLGELHIIQAQRAKDADRAAFLEKEAAEKDRIKADESRRDMKELGRIAEAVKVAQEKEIKDASVRRIADWLEAPQFAETLEYFQEHRIENTAQWIFQKDEFTNWASMEILVNESVSWRTMPPWVLWAHGNPGCGKTMMASSVYDELVEQKRSKQLDHMVCYFFFKHTDQKSLKIDAVYRSALAQILHRYRDESEILDKFLFIQSDSSSSSGQSRATAKQLYDLMRISASALGHIDFVVDGVDEADEPGDISDRLKVLVTTSPIRLICFSRSNVSRLQYLVPPQQQIAFSRDLTNPDIRAFLELEISGLVEETKLPSTADHNSLVESLLSGADGMFLWAKLMMRYLRSPALSRTTRLCLIKGVRLPEGLDEMYDRMVSLIMNSTGPELNLAKDVLLWIRHPKPNEQKMGIDWLHTAVGYELDPDEKDGFVNMVIAVCHGLVEFTDRGGFNLTHLTVNEYFDKKWLAESGKAVLLPDTATTTPEVTSRCVDYLIAITPSEPPHDRWSRNIYGSREAMMSFQTSFEAYAAAEWVYSLTRIPHESVWAANSPGRETYAADIDRLKVAIERFLGNPLGVALWIESLYALNRPIQKLIQSLSEFVRPYDRQLCTLDKRLAKQLLDITEDLRVTEQEWGPTLLKKPYLVWSDVILFSKLKTFSKIDSPSFGTVFSLILNDGKDSNWCNESLLCSVSSTSSDGRMTGTLSIVPAADFVQSWRGSNVSEAYARGERFCDGWVAHYEIWSHDSRSKQASFQIPLPQEEILIALRQSFRESLSDPGSLEIAFPLAIGPDCLAFTVLRTVYKILPGQSKPLATYQSSLLPLECFEHFRVNWGNELHTFEFWHRICVRPYWRDVYRYSISFSPDSKMLSFADYRMPCQVNMAIFKVIQGATLSLQCVQTTRANMLSSPPVKEMHFHPWRALLVFLAETRTYLWKFGAAPIRLPTAFDESSEKPYALSFSRCGKFVLVRNATDTVVLRLPNEKPRDTSTVQDRRVATRRRSPRYVGTSSSLISRVHSRDDQGLRDQDLQGITLSGAHLSMAGDCPNVLTIVPGGNNISLELSTPGYLGGEKIQRHLVTLPNTHDTNDKAISIKFPETPGEPLRIIIDKSATDGYTLDEGRHFDHPIVIEKNRYTSRRDSAPSAPCDRMFHGLSRDR
ncbi:hypothetical protein PG988_008062 [Apiospora saccharicola]